MPTHSGGAAEVNVVAGSLQGEAGSGIDYEPPAAFRAAIQ
jgi:hypothetical protein